MCRYLLRDTWSLPIRKTKDPLSMKETFKENFSCVSCKPRTVLGNMGEDKRQTIFPLENGKVFW